MYTSEDPWGGRLCSLGWQPITITDGAPWPVLSRSSNFSRRRNALEGLLNQAGSTLISDSVWGPRMCTSHAPRCCGWPADHTLSSQGSDNTKLTAESGSH